MSERYERDRPHRSRRSIRIAIWAMAGIGSVIAASSGLLPSYGCGPSLGLLWPFAPMHQREVLAAGGATPSDTLHQVLAY